MTAKQFVCKASEVPHEAAKIVPFGKFSIGIFKLNDGYHALLNICPHRGAALCEGPVCGTTKATDTREFVYERKGELIRCAWHGWEFDIRTGEFLVDPAIRARRFPVTLEGDDIFIHV
jgi:nitrite reductase/ring-hydroxylating ferredoxin subunit